ncbi:MAG: hypothetical protein LC798_07100 [Chloroflexi bacterium]|nr:hypothetical protein [Chloroflexota bacterium]
MAWLNDNPPVRPQFRHPRRAKCTGCIVLHSAESQADVSPPDTGAENVARFIRTRADVGSYHVICDSDTAIQLVEFGDEAYQDGTGSNPWAIGISGAFQAHQFAGQPEVWKRAVVDQMAKAVKRAADWVDATYGVTVPPASLTKAQSDAGKPGLIPHALRDPGRRSDPGGEAFARVLARYAQLTTVAKSSRRNTVAIASHPLKPGRVDEACVGSSLGPGRGGQVFHRTGSADPGSPDWIKAKTWVPLGGESKGSVGIAWTVSAANPALAFLTVTCQAMDDSPQHYTTFDPGGKWTGPHTSPGKLLP